jgi:hypothetical protein
MIDEVALGRDIFQVFWFPLPVFIPPISPCSLIILSLKPHALDIVSVVK